MGVACGYRYFREQRPSGGGLGNWCPHVWGTVWAREVVGSQDLGWSPEDNGCRGRVIGRGSPGKPIRTFEPSHWDLNVLIEGEAQKHTQFSGEQAPLVNVEQSYRLKINYIRKCIHKIGLNTPTRLWKNIIKIFCFLLIWEADYFGGITLNIYT